MTIGHPVTARAHANIALVKYWGKRDPDLNLPAAGSLSLTLDALTTTTRVCFGDELAADTFSLDGEPAPEAARARLSGWLELVRKRAGISARASVTSSNDFPTASGLASSASGFAALALAATCAAGLELSPAELSVLARRGSGSAARSLFGGFVEMLPGSAADGNDCHAVPLESPRSWDVRMAIAILGGGVKKKHPSTDAMRHCAETSPLYQGWIASVAGDIERARAAVAAAELDALGEVAEASALAMHAAAIASRPAIIYWYPETLACIERVRALRASGVRAYATMDAGPHVKVLTDGDNIDAVIHALEQVSGVDRVLESGPGGPAQRVDV